MILIGDNLPHLRGLADKSVDAIVTDCPYGLGKTPTPAQILAYMQGADLVTGDFMGKKWDIPSVAVWAECYRILKPGRVLLTFAGTRTFGLIEMGLRMADFQPTDSILAPSLAWVHSQSFPKGKMLLKPAWEPVLMMRKPGPLRALGIDACRVGTDRISQHGRTGDKFGFTSAEPAGREWSGRYPSNALLIHSPFCQPAGVRRVKGGNKSSGSLAGPMHEGPGGFGHKTTSAVTGYAALDGTEEVSAWLCAPGCQVAALDAQGGVRKSGKLQSHHKRSGNSQIGTFQMRDRTGEACDFGGDEGACSRFYPTFSWQPDDFFPLWYQAKPSRAERNKGCGGLEKGDDDSNLMTSDWKVDARHPDGGYPTTKTKPRANHHTTVKSIELMRWLVRLVSEPGETVLDPYLGSGTTACACEQEGRQWIGIEREPEYVAIAETRVAAWRQRQLNLFGGK